MDEVGPVLGVAADQGIRVVSRWMGAGAHAVASLRLAPRSPRAAHASWRLALKVGPLASSSLTHSPTLSLAHSLTHLLVLNPLPLPGMTPSPPPSSATSPSRATSTAPHQGERGRCMEEFLTKKHHAACGCSSPTAAPPGPTRAEPSAPCPSCLPPAAATPTIGGTCRLPRSSGCSVTRTCSSQASGRESAAVKASRATCCRSGGPAGAPARRTRAPPSRRPRLSQRLARNLHPQNFRRQDDDGHQGHRGRGR